MEANANAATEGANKSVKGYLTFLLFSVAGLACQSFRFPFLDNANFLFAIVVRFVGATTYMVVRLFAGE